MKRFKGRLAGAAAFAACAFALGPLTAQSVAQTTRTPTAVKAYSVIADVNTVNFQANVPLRPSGRLFRITTGGPVPLANRYLTFFAAGEPLCAELTDVTGYAECKGPVRLRYPAEALGKFTARFLGTSTFAPSQDTGQLLTLGSVEIFR